MRRVYIVFGEVLAPLPAPPYGDPHLFAAGPGPLRRGARHLGDLIQPLQSHTLFHAQPEMESVMAKSASVILDELAKGLEDLRSTVAPRAPRARAVASAAESTDIEKVVGKTDDLKEIFATVERHVIDRAMRKVRGNQSKGAQLLNISRGALIAKLKSYRIEDYRHSKRAPSEAARRRTLGHSAVPPMVRAGARRRGRPAKPAVDVKAPTRTEKRARRMSPKLRALRVLQGKFLGALRGLKPRQRERIKKVRSEKGYEAALQAAAGI